MIGLVFIGEHLSLDVVCVGGDDLETCRLFAQRPLAILPALANDAANPVTQAPSLDKSEEKKESFLKNPFEYI